MFLLPLGRPRFFPPTFTEFTAMVFTGFGAAGISTLVGITGSGTAGTSTLLGITGSGTGAAGTSTLMRIKGSGVGSSTTGNSTVALTGVPF